jgi:GDP-L-fucose synthase
VAKIAGIEMRWAFNRQYGTQYIAAMPTNLYGPNDNYNLESSHGLGALLRKMHDAKEAGASEVSVWGTGMVRREFIHSDDLGDACVFLLNWPDEVYLPIAKSESQAPLLNIGCGMDLTIRELAEIIRDVAEFRGAFAFDTSKPDGTPRKLLDVSRMKELGCEASIPLREGLAAVYREYATRQSVAKGQSVSAA